jgi:hypothetical protein
MAFRLTVQPCQNTKNDGTLVRSRHLRRAEFEAGAVILSEPNMPGMDCRGFATLFARISPRRSQTGIRLDERRLSEGLGVGRTRYSEPSFPILWR